MAKFQLWSRDEYGQGSIIFTSEKIDEIIKRAKSEVTDINVNNALTGDDRDRNWESYFVEIVPSVKDQSTKKYIYGSRDEHVVNRVYIVDGDKIEKSNVESLSDCKIKIYLGNISSSNKIEKDWFGKDIKGKEISNINDPILSDKTSFFVKII
jgi:hypothetical protein